VEPGLGIMQRTDAELIAQWQQGDQGAFAALVERWQQPIGRFLAHLVGDAERVDDLVQEVFLRVYEAGSRYRETGAFSTWLYRIALNAARDAGRRRRHAPLSLVGVEPRSCWPAPEKVCEQQELAEIVARAVAELPERLRLVLVLRHYEEMPFEEMARLTGTPASTLKSRFTAALERLRHRLRRLGCD
jgi:RNA polymerase sigma-70 factor (ECF subfamily)